MRQNRMSRRSLIGQGTGMAAGAGLVGLAKPSAVFAVPAVIQDGGSRVQVQYWTSFGSGVNGDAQNKLIADFNASQADIEVVATPQESYEAIAQGLITGLQTGDVPDMVLFSEAWWFRFYLANAIVDLNTFITEETNAADYVPILFNEYQRNGGQYAIPFARSTPLLYYNTGMVEAAGLTGEVYAKWSSLQEAGQDLIDGSGAERAFAFGSAAGYGSWFLQGTVWGFNGAYSDDELNILLTEEGAVEAGEAMRNLVQSGVASAVADPNQDFLNGTTVATFASTGGLGNLTATAEFPFTTAFLPAEYTFGCCTGGSGLALLNTSPEEVQQAGFKFIEYCTSTEVTTYWAQTTGYMPVRISARDSESMQAFFAENPNSKTAVDQLEQVDQVDAVMVAVPNGAQYIGQGWEQILVNNVPAADAWAETTEILNTEKEPVLAQIQEVEGE
ncbi:MAG: ABC transporter substrate-binding protein [Chloroflexia bacterium]|nr:ABC transporter substrate-binding protein [Chloroflexia bacterium]